MLNNCLKIYFVVLSDPDSVCLNTSTLSPYNALASTDDELTKNVTSAIDDGNNCNSCICLNGKPKCSNLWCGLPNCLKENINRSCEIHEVCVPLPQETCLSPPCIPRGDCRRWEPSHRVPSPKLPKTTDCWPNQARLGDRCARITVVLENKRIPLGTSVESICFNLRTLLGTRMVNLIKEFEPPLLVVLCDIKIDSNDTIEVTVVCTFLCFFF